jgi:phosphopentomutase
LIKRVIIIVLDGCGVGELPDAADYGDAGSNTLGNLSRAIPGGLALPNLERLGLGNITPLAGVKAVPNATGCWGKNLELSHGKDSTSGHWEIAGLVVDKPFPTFPNGFPPEILDPFRKMIGRDILANTVASGTEIIKQYGEQHQRTGFPIIYTSADSVFQIACHEGTVPLETLYDWCRMARGLLAGPHAVGRVIARPFTGSPGSYQRVGGHRHDFSVPPSGPTMLDRLKDSGRQVIGLGKIHDLYAGQGLTENVHTDDNRDGMARLIETLSRLEHGLLMMNLVEFDMTWGHRNDTAGFAGGLSEFDAWLPSLLGRMTAGDLLLLTADHGNDPTTPSTDHSREHTPLLACGPGIRSGVDLGTRGSFADIAATVAEIFSLRGIEHGESFLPQITNQ